jgi:hypothetical protein
VILGGDYGTHRSIALALGVVVPERGEMVSLQVVPAAEDDANYVEIGGRLWRAAFEADLVASAAPIVPYR